MIVPVKKVKLAVLNDYEEALLKNLQRYGLLMLIPLEERRASCRKTSSSRGPKNHFGW